MSSELLPVQKPPKAIMDEVFGVVLESRVSGVPAHSRAPAWGRTARRQVSWFR
jgi:hypothetical protein